MKKYKYVPAIVLAVMSVFLIVAFVVTVSGYALMLWEDSPLIVSALSAIFTKWAVLFGVIGLVQSVLSIKNPDKEFLNTIVAVIFYVLYFLVVIL